MRGFRPSYFHDPSEDLFEEYELNKEENVQRYSARARKGLPIFDDELLRSHMAGQIAYYSDIS